MLEVRLVPEKIPALIGREVAIDVMAKSGDVLVAKGSELTLDLIEKLMRRDIRSVRIVPKADESIVEEKPLVPPVPPATPAPKASQPARPAAPAVPSIIEEPIFQAFAEEHGEKVDEVKQQLHNVLNGDDADTGLLNDITENIISRLNRRSDVLSYIRHLEDTNDIVFTHSVNVSMLCNLFGHWLKMNDEEIASLTVAGSLHDVGMTKVPKEILEKPGKLTNAEYAIMKEHTTMGYEILKYQDLPEEVKLAALEHHERIDGSGYPKGLTAGKISKFGSIVAICDIYDAMISKRQYRDLLSPFEVINTFEQKMYSGMDTKLLIVFLKNIAHTFLHSHVRLSDGRVGKVIFINNAHLSRPIVDCGGEFVDLAEHKKLLIERVF